MGNVIYSRFSVSSTKFDAEFLKGRFPWRLVESSEHPPSGKVNFHVTVFDLGVGKHSRVDQHLVAANTALLQLGSELEALSDDCKFALWITYSFPADDGAINISHPVSAALGLLNVELIFHLKPQ